MDDPVVKVGQIWRDRDYRMHHRFIRVIGIDGDRATVRECNIYGEPIINRVSKILVRRFRPTSTGFDLISEAVQ